MGPPSGALAADPAIGDRQHVLVAFAVLPDELDARHVAEKPRLGVAVGPHRQRCTVLRMMHVHPERRPARERSGPALSGVRRRWTPWHRRQPRSGTNIASSGMVGVHPEHCSQPFGCVNLGDTAEIGRERHHVAAARALNCEIRPLAGFEIHLETAGPAISAARVPCDVLGTLNPAAGQPASEDFGQAGERRAVDPGRSLSSGLACGCGLD